MSTEKTPELTIEEKRNYTEIKETADIKITGPKTLMLNGYYMLSKGLFAVLRHNILEGENSMIVGATGLGKTELIENIAKVLNKKVTIFDMGTMTDPIMGLVGTHTITVEDGVTKSSFTRSRFSEVIQEPGIVLLDELSRAGVMANNLLFPVLDYRRELSMEYAFDDTTPVKVHPECVFIATANIGSQYTGTHKMDRALVDRFMTIEVDPLEKSEVMIMMKQLFPKISEEKLKKMVDVYESINKDHEEFKISFNMSLRHLKQIAKLVQNGITIYDSFVVVCKGLGSKEGLEAVKHLLDTAKSLK